MNFGSCRMSIDINSLQPGFKYLLFERVNREKNEFRYYYLSWQPSLFDRGAVVRTYGRLTGQSRTLAPVPFPTLDDAWPLIRATIRARLRNGYTVVEPEEIAQVIQKFGIK